MRWRGISTDGGGGTVRFSSTFPAATTITLTSEQGIDKNLTIDGTGHRVTINGGGSGFETRRLFTVNGGATFAVTGMTLTGGNLNGGNSGGAIFNSGTLTVTDSTISGNSANRQRRRHLQRYGTVTVMQQHPQRQLRQRRNGGGIDNDGGTLTVTNSTLSGNSAERQRRRHLQRLRHADGNEQHRQRQLRRQPAQAAAAAASTTRAAR